MARGYRYKFNGEYIGEDIQGYTVLDDGEYRVEGSPSLGWTGYMYIPICCETCGVKVIKGMMGCFVGESFFCAKCYPNGIVIGTLVNE